MRIDFDNSVIKQSHTTPVVAQFSADWCGPCKMIAPLIDKVMTSRSDFEWVVIDVDTNPQPSMSNGIRAVPTILLFKKGVPVSKYTGGFSTVKFNEWLNVNT